MSSLRELIETARKARADYIALRDEEGSTCNQARYEELKGLIVDQRNRTYNAVQDLREAFYEELGIWPRELADIASDFGYTIGKNVRVKANVDLGD